MKLLIVDANSIIYRAFYGVKLLTTKSGKYTNAIYGFLNIVLRICDELSPDSVVFAFDTKTPTFRHEMYAEYKGTRKSMPDELATQLPEIDNIIDAMGYTRVSLEGFEADDILGTLSLQGRSKNDSVFLLTGDRDSLQLVDESITVLLATGGEYREMTPEAIYSEYTLTPLQLIELKALVGDKSDNIPGVAGIGPKTATPLIQQYGSIDSIYENIAELKVSASTRQKLINSKELAFKSKVLGTIRRDAPLPEYSALTINREPDEARLYTILAGLEMHSTIKRLKLNPSTDSPAAKEQEIRVEYTRATAVDELLSAERIYIFAELAEDRITGLSAATAKGQYFSTENTADIDKILASDAEKILDDSKAVYRYCILNGISLSNIVFDIRLAGYILNPHSSDYSVNALSGEYSLSYSTQLDEREAYAVAMVELSDLQRAQIEENEQTELYYNIELPLAEVLANMELSGFKVDTAGIAEFGRLLDVSIVELEEEIYQLAGESFNINSPKQLGVILFEKLGLSPAKKTKTGYSTNAEVLEELRYDHDIIDKILDYRKYSKLKSTYVEGLLKVTDENSTIHTRFNQTETRTGRISSLEPNLQNIPIRTELGATLRNFFVAREGNVLVDADYSQIELRVLAALASDDTMIEAFRSGEDIHSLTAAQVFDVDPIFVTKEMRSRAKAVNFGIVYGIGAFSLSKDIGVSVAEAKKYIESYLATYAGVSEYLKSCVSLARQYGYAKTYFNRRRALPELASTKKQLAAFGERVAMNMPIQGTAADIIKIAMVTVFRRLKNELPTARLILQVHDELIVECPKESAEQAAVIVKEAMESAVDMCVPMLAEVNIADNWGGAH